MDMHSLKSYGHCCYKGKLQNIKIFMQFYLLKLDIVAWATEKSICFPVSLIRVMSTREELSHWAKVEKSMKEIKKLLLRK
jgi:hypothetical protein